MRDRSPELPSPETSVLGGLFLMASRRTSQETAELSIGHPRETLLVQRCLALLKWLSPDIHLDGPTNGGLPEEVPWAADSLVREKVGTSSASPGPHRLINSYPESHMFVYNASP